MTDQPLCARGELSPFEINRWKSWSGNTTHDIFSALRFGIMKTGELLMGVYTRRKFTSVIGYVSTFSLVPVTALGQGSPKVKAINLSIALHIDYNTSLEVWLEKGNYNGPWPVPAGTQFDQFAHCPFHSDNGGGWLGGIFGHGSVGDRQGGTKAMDLDKYPTRSEIESGGFFLWADWKPHGNNDSGPVNWILDFTYDDGSTSTYRNMGYVKMTDARSYWVNWGGPPTG